MKIAYDIPQEMIDLAKDPQTAATPQRLCLVCPALGRTCGGVNEVRLTSAEWRSYITALSQHNGLSRPALSEKSGVSINTVNSILSGRTDDPRLSSMQSLSCAAGGSCNYPCHIAQILLSGDIEGYSADKSIEGIQHDNARLREALDISGARLRKAEKDAEKQIDYLKSQIETQRKEKRFSQAIAVILAAFIIVLFAVDLLVGTVGWFRF